MGLGRDPERTPMQWDASPDAGFTRAGVEPWLPLAADYREVNVAAQREDPASFLTLYRRLIALRRAEPALHVGAYEPVGVPDDVGELIAYVRATTASRRFLVVLNLSGEPQTFRAGRHLTIRIAGRIVLSTSLDRDGEAVAGEVKLRGDEGVVIELTSAM